MRPVVAALLASALAACGRQATTPPEPQPAPAPAPPSPSTGSAPDDDVVLQSPGAEPRAPLRYAVPDQTIRHVAWRMLVAGRTTPLSWRYQFHRTGAAMSLAMRIHVEEGPLARSEAEWAFSDRGRHAPSTGDARLVLQQTQAEHMLPILPAQPVGIGASWAVPTSISAGVGVGEIPGHTRWELVALDGSIATLRGTLDAPETTLPFRDTVMKVSAKGSIDTRIDLTAFTGEAAMELAMRTGDMASASTVTMQIR